MKRSLALLASLLVLLPSAGAQERAYPSKPLRILLGYTPGGTADIVARLVAEKLTIDRKSVV